MRMVTHSDPNLDTLLDLDGVIFALSDDPAPYWVKFIVKQVLPSPDRPHGLEYSLTMHGPDGGRVAGSTTPIRYARDRVRGPDPHECDHRHRRRSVRPYEYQDAGTLMLDFWTEVESVITGKDKHMKTLKVGIATYEQFKARTIAIAKGKYKPQPDEPKIWYTSLESFAKLLSTKNRALLKLIAETHPVHCRSWPSKTGRAKSNLSRTLKTMERYGLVQFEKGHGRNRAPRVNYTDLALDVPLQTL